MFEFRPITPHIWRLTIEWKFKMPFVPPIPVAVWLVKGEDWTVVDSGIPECATDTVEAIRQFLQGSQPSRLVLTHAHYDHGGAIAEMVNRWQLPVWAHPRETPFVEGRQRYRDIASKNWLFNATRRFVAEQAWQRPVNREVQEGDWVGAMQVLEVPGHAPGMIALHHLADRAVICGDAYMNLGGRMSGPLTMATPDPAAAVASAKKLAALDADWVLPSHDISERGLAMNDVRRFAARL